MTSLVRMNVFGFTVKGVSVAALAIMCTWGFSLEQGFAQNPVQRDQQALAILAHSIAAAGGLEQLTSIQDFTETGTVTYYWTGQPTGNITVKSRGLQQFRIDADLPEGRRSTVVNGYGGAVKEVNGWTRHIRPQSAADAGSMTFPYLPLIGAMQDTSTSIIYRGLVTQDGASVQDVQIQRSYSKQQDPLGNRGKLEARDIFIDPNTYLVVAVSDQIVYGSVAVPHEVLYSNYKLESGVSVPLTITETMNATTTLTMQLTQVTFNSQVNDADFSW